MQSYTRHTGLFVVLHAGQVRLLELQRNGRRREFEGEHLANVLTADEILRRHRPGDHTKREARASAGRGPPVAWVGGQRSGIMNDPL